MPGETVLTTRRARCRVGGGAAVAGRLRLTDRRVVLTALDGSVLAEAALAEVAGVRLVRRPQAWIAFDSPAGPVRLRCFEVAAVAALLRAARRP